MRLGNEIMLSPERTLDIVLESLRELVDYELAVVMGYYGDDRLIVRTTKGPLASSRLSGYSISLSARSDIADLIALGRPRLFRDDEAHEDIYTGVLDLPAGHSCIAAPLMIDGTAIGLLTLDHRTCGVFSEQILSFIGVISRLIAVALAQSEASRALQDRNSLLIAERNRLLARDDEAFRDLVGSSPAWLSALDSIKLVAATESTVLLLGETGTGKEEAARAIHRLSPRVDKPFVAVNCSAMPAALAESELFGHEKGAFTDARSLRRGRFELADGGTLFLDEIGDLPTEIQPKLLRALQEGNFERVGGESSVRVDVRVIAATHADLGAAVDEGRFREDLFYRVAVFPIRLPPLRERHGDAIVLAEFFASRLRSRPGWARLSFDAEALEALEENPWPGNVRELRNAVERAGILCRGGTIGASALLAGDWAKVRGSSRVGSRITERIEAPCGGVETLAEAERRYVAAALERANGKIYGPGGAAEALGLKPSTLQSRMKKLGLNRKGD
ncbi:MAG: AAA family ATPase [Spirochaetae bacterium HGW-Spirochaetae-3]|nr:MAG: AAA family ATPase [Spirochaetae bacterium HGW-Spirochaetae-3]